MIALLAAIALALLAFALRAAAGGLTAIDPSRLAPTQEALGLASPPKLEQAVAAMQLGSTLAAAASAALFARRFYEQGGAIGFLVALVGAAVLAFPLLEILPLLYQTPRGGRRLAIGLLAYAPLSWPLRIIRASGRGLIERLIPGPGPNSSVVMSVRRETLAAFSDERHDARTLRQAQKRLVTQVYEFSESTVEEVMVPRSRIIGIPAEATVGEAIDRAGEHQFSRYPVHRENLDQVDGVLHVYDLLSAPGRGGAITPHVRPIPFAPEAKKCDELLSELRRAHHHAAIVVDEFGGTAGWVTVEDLLEELVGEIRDEHDVEEEAVRSVGRRLWQVDAGIRIDELNRTLHLEIPEGDYETLAGWLLEEIERIPRRGESVAIEGAHFLVTDVDPRRILKVRVERVD